MTIRTDAVGSTPQALDNGRDAAKINDAAQQFEALLIGQMLRTIRESGGGWLGTGEDAASESATGMAEEQLARALTAQGGLGLASLAVDGLAAPKSTAKVAQKE